MPRGLVNRHSAGAISLGAVMLALPLVGSVRAATLPATSITATRAKIQIASASLSESIDALARAAGFKVTYEGPRPSAMLFNTEIDTPSVSETLFKLLDGQNLNYAVLFDATGRKVSSLMILGVAPRTGGGTTPGSSRPQAFANPRNPRSDSPATDEETLEAAPVEPLPEPIASPVASPAATPNRGPGPSSPYPPPPFAPRPPFGSAFGPRPTPSPSP